MSNVTGSTQVYAIIGWPVAHSLSPVMQNAAFSACGINAVYIPFPVKETQLCEAVSGLRALNICGCNVTVPHKEKIARYLDRLAPEAEAIGAVNTVVRKNSVLVGHNTDADGFLHSLEFDLDFYPKQKRIFVLGAGGAARACAYALARGGASQIWVANRNIKRAECMCADFTSLFPATTMSACGLGSDIFNAATEKADLIVNTTSIGLHDWGDDPLVWGNINSKTLFYDVVYKSGATTPMVARARKRGLCAADGLGMLIAQGEQSFRLWTGADPGAAMRQALAARTLR